MYLGWMITRLKIKVARASVWLFRILRRLLVSIGLIRLTLTKEEGEKRGGRGSDGSAYHGGSDGDDMRRKQWQ
ncbi:hypothetical protein BHE74_00021240 [Ensete ventricosum]|nr:hypothetical protein BHE74_00021240 [Ensete ventricosum]